MKQSAGQTRSSDPSSCTKAANNIDRLPKELKNLVDTHRPKPTDIDCDGYADKGWLTEEAKKLFERFRHPRRLSISTR
jgi:hypothetical protein